MIFLANIKMALRSLWGSKQRSFLALIGIAIGIGSVISMVTVGTIVQNEAINQFKELGTDFLVINKEWGSSAKGNNTIKLTDAMALPRFASSLASAAPYVQSGANIVYGNNEVNAQILGVTNAFASINRLKLVDGRFISDLDIAMPFCLIGEELRSKLRAIGIRTGIGDTIKIQEVKYTIIGILPQVSRGGICPYSINDAILMPIATVIKSFDNAEINTLVARIKQEVGSAQAIKDINRYFNLNLRGIKVRVDSAEALIVQLEKQMNMFRLMLGAIGSISLIVGGVGVMNVMLVSVTERRQEIGIRRALGATQGDIQSQFIIESLVLSLIGGFCGIGGGILTTYIIANVNHWQFVIAHSSIVLGAGVSSAVGIFFGFYPSRQAARLNPITALRS